MSEELASVKKHKHEVFFELEDVGPDDYMVSLTDAARMTRRQEVTIRQWIAKGELPVARQRIGLNKRTRQVRVSDLAKLTPILDSSAKITSKQGQLSLMNIPAEQAEIKEIYQRLLEEHQQLLAELADLHHQMETYALTTNTVLAEHAISTKQEMSVLRTSLASQISGIEHVLDLQHRQDDSLAERITADRTLIDQVRLDLTHLDTLQQQRITSFVEQLTQREETLRQQQQHLASEMSLQHQDIRGILRALQEKVAAAQQEQDRAIQQLREQMEKATASLQQRGVGLASRLEFFIQAAEQQAKQQEAFDSHLAEEAKARDSLSEQVNALEARFLTIQSEQQSEREQLQYLSQSVSKRSQPRKSQRRE